MVAGCGGGGSGGGNNGGAAPPPDPTTSRVNLPISASQPFGRVSVYYLPRQGRIGDTLVATISQVELRLGADTFIQALAQEINFLLNGPEVQSRDANVPLGTSDSRLFDTYVLTVRQLVFKNDDTDITIGGDNTPALVQDFPAAIRVMRGRETSMEVRLNDGILSVDEFGQLQFDQSTFEALNMPDGVVQGYLSDFMMFDISSFTATRPIMSNGQTALRVYFSGDRFMLSGGGPTGYIEAYGGGALLPRPGEFVDPQPASVPPGTLVATPGEYRLLIADPNDANDPPGNITDMRGMFRPFYDPALRGISLIIPASTFDVLLLPSSSAPDEMQMLFVVHNGNGKTTNLYFGTANLTLGTFVAYPAANLPTGATSGEITGTLGGFTGATGGSVLVDSPDDAEAVRRGSYQILGGAPTGIAGNGTFLVFR